jgi:indolepyruvate ferredoxin oxidoreductase
MTTHLPDPSLAAYTLDDRYEATEGRVFMTGTQALVRIMLDQARRDHMAGLKTGGFVSGYRGSPLGAVDQSLWQAAKRIEAAGIKFLPAVNEDLAATAVLGSQQVESHPSKQVDGVFALWYGKGPGVDRAGDALKHGNAYGSSPHGGVLVVAGDDHGCVSSSMSHQSDVAFMAWYMPVLNPASVAEYLSFGAFGFALSRHTGLWVGFKAISETVESGMSFDLPSERQFLTPNIPMPADGLHYRWPDLPGPQIEARMVHKKRALQAFVEANPIDHAVYHNTAATYGFVTTGKAHLDLMETLRLLGLDEAQCRQLGIDIYKVGLVWPLARRDALAFVRGKKEVLVVEEKRGIVESQFKEYFYDTPGHKPDCMVGKADELGADLIPWVEELSPSVLAPLVAARLHRHFPALNLPQRAQALRPSSRPTIHVAGATRTPYFCSGCPHNSSTVVPEGSQALAGIGCHFMASWMDRETTSLIQMGGEGVNWAASSMFTGKGHVFQNLGEGTYYHSGSMAIRQAIAAKANITYKILYNDAVAMTGGQPVDGPLSVHAVAHSVRAEGVSRIALVSDDPSKFSPADLPSGTTLHHRRDLDPVQRELREVPGVSVLIYEQPCATETRRRRKRGLVDDPKRFAVINDLVCEGCGDCSVASNCLSVEPKETPWGRKRQINLASCNKDFSCLEGFCPSFVTVEGGTRRKKNVASDGLLEAADALPAPRLPDVSKPYNLLINGVGGTGVITVGAIVAMAAHLEHKGVSVLDFMGFAQKFGTVISYLRIAETPHALNQLRIDQGSADALIGCDIVASSSPKSSGLYRAGMQSVVNVAAMPTGDFPRHRDADLALDARAQAIEQVVGAGCLTLIDANDLAQRQLGDPVFANMVMLGAAWQQGLVPVSMHALLRAIELNGVVAHSNHLALAVGRLAVAAPERLVPTTVAPAESLQALIARQAEFLTQYQNPALAKRFEATLAPLRAAAPDQAHEPLVAAAARSLFKLLAYKDEYEVARLHMNSGFLAQLKDEFEGDFQVHYHLAPPGLPGPVDSRGRPRKRSFGPWIQKPMRVLASLKGLRGTPFDPFGWNAERREERALIPWFESVMGHITAHVGKADSKTLMALAQAPMYIRG